MNINTDTFLMISIPRECNKVLNRVAAARNRRNPDLKVTPEVIAREAVIEYVDEVERIEAGLKACAEDQSVGSSDAEK
jgi:predicted transcriptional regulator